MTREGSEAREWTEPALARRASGPFCFTLLSSGVATCQIFRRKSSSERQFPLDSPGLRGPNGHRYRIRPSLLFLEEDPLRFTAHPEGGGAIRTI